LIQGTRMTSPRSFEALVLITDKSRVPDSDAQSVRLNPREPLSLSPTGFPRRLRDEAERLPHGLERETLLRKARQADIAASIDTWVASPGLQPPR
jgi:hypothetical protein